MRGRQEPKDPIPIILGSANESARGLRAALGLFNDHQFGQKIKMGIVALEDEWRADASQVTSEHRANFKYVREGTAGVEADIPEHVRQCIARGEYHGGKLSPGDFDRGHEGMTLEHFHQVWVCVRVCVCVFVCVRAYVSVSVCAFVDVCL